MKPMTIWQRLDRALLLLILLLFVAVGLAFWVAWENSNARQRSDKASGDRDHIYYDVMLVIDSLRGMAADPGNELERRRHREAERELEERLESMQKAFKDFSDLLNSLKNLNDFVRGTSSEMLGNFQNKVLTIAETDTVGALNFFTTNYPPVSRLRDQLFKDLYHQVEQVTNAETMRASTVTLIGGTCIILVALIAYAVGRQQSSAIAEPLNRLVGNLDRMRRGDFTERLSLDQKDEFGVVGQGLNRLADDMCELVGQVQRSGIQVNTTATQIAATAKEQQSTAHEIAATTSQIGATSKEISATSKELVKTMNEVNHVAEETAKLAGSGQASIARMESTMHQIMEASGAITAKLAVLSEKTTNINSVVTTITKVADQTNLLSLNAAIEAEKAGEYGLGFAVVAMEIRRLADQTAVATYDIEKMVKEMHSAVAAGVMGMDKFSDEVRRGVAEVRQVSTHLAQIIHQVQTLTPRFQTVNEGMHAQATGAEQISETLTQLSEAAQQTAESLRQSNLAIEQLNGAARGLQASVARFKLSSQPLRSVGPAEGYAVGI
jgi:methyl-accepting chemotaxis protein WspA